MTRAQERLAAFVEWVKASSTSYKAPNGRDTVVKGPYAVFIPQALSLPPGPTFAPEHLPLWIPEQQAVPGLPPFVQDPPMSQPSVADRLGHIVWCFTDGRFEGAILSLTDPDEPLQSVMDRQAPALDLSTHPVLFAPVWGLDVEAAEFLDRRLPLVTRNPVFTGTPSHPPPPVPIA